MLLINTRVEGYTIEQCGDTMTVGELIDLLDQYDENTEIFFKNDSGYSYGRIEYDDIEEY